MENMLAASMNQQGRSPYIIVINCGEIERLVDSLWFVAVALCGWRVCYFCLDINPDTARKAEEHRMLNDANMWIRNPDMPEYEDSRTGATALHVAAVKGYHNVIS